MASDVQEVHIIRCTVCHILKGQTMARDCSHQVVCTCSLCYAKIHALCFRMSNTNAVDTICATFVDYAQDFVHIKPSMFDKLIEEGQKRILREYLRALLSR